MSDAVLPTPAPDTQRRGPDFRLWEPGRVVFRTQDGVSVRCPACGLVGARITYWPGQVIHVASWEPVFGHDHLSQLGEPVLWCKAG